MAKPITINSGLTGNVTVIPNSFFDYYLPQANGEFLKVYLYLLRWFPAQDHQLSLDAIADTLNITESDVIRALKYWESKDLLALACDNDGDIAAIYLMSIPEDDPEKSAPAIQAVPAKPAAQAGYPSAQTGYQSAPAAYQNAQAGYQNAPATYQNGPAYQGSPAVYQNAQTGLPAAAYPANQSISPVQSAPANQMANAYQPAVPGQQATGSFQQAAGSDTKHYTMQQLSQFGSSKNGEQLIFIIQQYLGRPLSQSDLHTIYYFYDDLGFSIDLIEYLFEYCVSNDHTHMRYIEKVALSWSSQHITTVEQARTQSEAYQRSCFSVLKAFGLNNRMPTSGEVSYIHKWTRTYGFSLELILEACRRTMMAVHTPSFEYTDKILNNWKTQNIFTMKDVLTADQVHNQTKAAKTQKKTAAPQKSVRPSSNKFHNFNQRSYDYGALEKKLSQRIQSSSNDTK